jgi:hypothetical protein
MNSRLLICTLATTIPFTLAGRNHARAQERSGAEKDLLGAGTSTQVLLQREDLQGPTNDTQAKS